MILAGHQFPVQRIKLSSKLVCFANVGKFSANAKTEFSAKMGSLTIKSSQVDALVRSAFGNVFYLLRVQARCEHIYLCLNVHSLF